MPGELAGAGVAPGATRLKVSAELLLRMMFRLPEGTTLEGASVDGAGGWPVLLLDVMLPGAPPDASSVDITYTKRNDIPDPVQVTGFRWFREDGTEIGALISGMPASQ